MVKEGVLIWISSEESFASSPYSLLTMAINSLIDSLRNSLSSGSRGVTGTGGLFWYEYFEVFPKSSWNSSSKYGNSEGWKPSFGVSSSGEGLWMGIMGSALAEETSSWLDSGSTQRGSRGGVFSRMRSSFPLWFYGWTNLQQWYQAIGQIPC